MHLFWWIFDFSKLMIKKDTFFISTSPKSRLVSRQQKQSSYYDKKKKKLGKYEILLGWEIKNIILSMMTICEFIEYFVIS